jgi:hypothetical protein
MNRGIKNFFVLGGNDAEMVRIKEILDAQGIGSVQPNKFWGPKSFRPDQIGIETMAPSASNRIVFVECAPAPEFPVVKAHVVIDHHGDNAGLPASILQVLDLLHMEPTRWDLVVAANDSGWFPGLQKLGATVEEMAVVRLADRSAQGITSEHEAEAKRALGAPVEMIGNIRVIRMVHSKTTPVIDRLAVEAIATRKPIPACLILSEDGEVNLVGTADGALCKSLFDRYREGGLKPAKAWAGGDGLGKVGKTAYWGGYPDQVEVLDFIQQYLSK